MSEKCISCESIRERINKHIEKYGVYETSPSCEGMEYVLLPYNPEIHEILLDDGLSDVEIFNLVSDYGTAVVDVVGANFEWAIWTGSRFAGKMTYNEWRPLLESMSKVQVRDDYGARAVNYDGRSKELLDFETANSYFIKCTVMSPAN